MAYASGGVWHTTTNGINFEPISENAPTQHIGELAMHWPSRTLWVGTGENNASRSSYAGIGMIKTTDNGASWQHAGLSDSHHIGKILIDPKDPNHVIVGSQDIYILPTHNVEYMKLPMVENNGLNASS